ncbi:TetR/AcrR family transcriptional regulator [Streptomyces sp. NBC_00687]|uniref:TetR/AcrR family transcriptional regulator n=1 Tax=Streptomyces sp. NBC_00687 TaxID=2975807 RepID=UPI00224EA6C1|nr:TetR/AcrR family transcriptional regulator [Streptomyces sp. NBC_00687]MCX4918903.1 TetR/AcrR family transcriptional regulator [Streptomyces sp. NBC_00687]
MRERVLDAARDLACSAGWDQVSLSAIATAADVSRPSVYKEFGNRAGLGRALVLRETRAFLESVAHSLYPGLPDTRASLEIAIAFVLTEAQRNPLIEAVIVAARQGSDSLLPYLTARADPIFDAAQDLLRAWFAERCPQVGSNSIEIAADITVRMTISHLLLPDADPSTTAKKLSGAVLKTLRER